MNPSQMLTIVGEANGENQELGRKSKSLGADDLQYINELTERVIYFIEEYRDSIKRLQK